MMNSNRTHRCFGARSGQVAVLGAITALFVTMCVMVVYHTGMVVNDKVDIQQAADSAAYSAALVEADSLSAIAWINDGMAYIYYKMMAAVVNNIIYGTLAAKQEAGGPVPFDAFAAWQDAFNDAQDWVMKGRMWLWELSAIEYGIAIATPEMMKERIYEVALANGAQSVAVYPDDFVMYPSPDAEFGLIAEWLGDGGWDIRSTDPDYPYAIRVEQNGENGYTINYMDMSGNVISAMQVTQNSEESWTIAWESGGLTGQYNIDKTDDGWVISGGDDTVTITEMLDEVPTNYVIQTGGTSIRIRRNNGVWEQFVDGEWVPQQAPPTVDVDGTAINVTDIGMISFGAFSMSLPPNAVWFSNFSVTLSNPPIITGQMGPAWFRTDAFGNIVINGLSSAVEVGELKKVWDNFGVNDYDTTFHKLQPIGTNTWQYDYRRFGSYLRSDDPYRFAVMHAICDNDPYFLETGLLPAWALTTNPVTGEYNSAGWFRPETGSSASVYDYYQTYVCSVCNGAGCYIGVPPDQIGAPPCFAVDNDGDGLTDIRTYQADIMMPDYQFTGAMPLPLVLTEDLFRFGITVAVWRDKRTDPVRLFEYPEWGSFAIAQARPGIYAADRGELLLQFFNTDDRDDWVETSPYNLYEPTWDAAMYSLNEAIQDYTLTEMGGLDPESDNGLSLLYRMIASAQWRDVYEGDANPVPASMFSSMRSPFNGAAFDSDSEVELREYVKH